MLLNLRRREITVINYRDFSKIVDVFADSTQIIMGPITPVIPHGQWSVHEPARSMMKRDRSIRRIIVAPEIYHVFLIF